MSVVTIQKLNALLLQNKMYVTNSINKLLHFFLN